MSTVSNEWSKPFDLLRRKWFEVPAGKRRLKSTSLLALSDAELSHLWEEARAQVTTLDFAERGWYFRLYRDLIPKCRLLDVGSGFGIDGITFAEMGAHVTFVDIIESNLEIIQRLCRYRGLTNVEAFYLRDLDSISNLPRNYDVIWCSGSQITMPFEVARREAQALLQHLAPGGRWIELAYPESRWMREGELPFERWGDVTDGGAPWIEWYDLEKMCRKLAPSRFEVILNFEYHNSEFVWFDLLRVPGSFEANKLALNESNKEEISPLEVKLRSGVEKTQGEVGWLVEQTKSCEEQRLRLAAENRALKIALKTIQNSAGWRMLNSWRSVRGRLAPEGTLRGRLYHRFIRHLQGGQA